MVAVMMALSSSSSSRTLGVGTRRRRRRFAQALFLATSFSALIACPHSKVEESFNLQATHDLYYYNYYYFRSLVMTPAAAAVKKKDDASSSSSSLLLSLQHFDHLQFPGVVPRTFTGPLLLALACQLLTWILSPIIILSDYPLLVQHLSRLLLLMTSWHAWFRLAHVIDKKMKNDINNNTNVGTYLLIITACQFHIPFYSSRMLPNIFALVLILHAYAEWILGNLRRSAATLVVATVVFRCDVLLLLFTIGLSWLLKRELTILDAIQVGVLSGITSLALTVPLDSWLWQQQCLVWPEGNVFYYNVILGKSSNWGILPWHWYFSNAIPKAMLLTILLVPLPMMVIMTLPPTTRRLVETRTIPSSSLSSWCRTYLVPILAFIGLYSCLGHKEMRFIFPAMPILNLMAAVGMAQLEEWAWPPKEKTSTLLAKLVFFAGIACIVLTLLASIIFVQVSRYNYPGGDALELLTRYLLLTANNQQHGIPTTTTTTTSSARVWIDVASSMSGVSLFGQRHAMYQTTAIQTWDKGGYEDENKVTSLDKYTHLLSEDEHVPGFHVIDVAQGHPRFDLQRARIATQNAIYVLERDGWNNFMIK